MKKKQNDKIYKTFRCGQIIKVDFGINIGAEHSDNLTIVPITSKTGKYNKRNKMSEEYLRIFITNVLLLILFLSLLILVIKK